MTLRINHMNYFLLTHLLLDTLKDQRPGTDCQCVLRDAHTGGPLEFDHLQSRRSYGIGGMGAYQQSKLMNVMFTYELSRRLARQRCDG